MYRRLRERSCGVLTLWNLARLAQVSPLFTRTERLLAQVLLDVSWPCSLEAKGSDALLGVAPAVRRSVDFKAVLLHTAPVSRKSSDLIQESRKGRTFFCKIEFSREIIVPGRVWRAVFRCFQ